MNLTAVDLRRVLTRLFDEEELETLCFDLRVDYESLPATPTPMPSAATPQTAVQLCTLKHPLAWYQGKYC